MPFLDYLLGRFNRLGDVVQASGDHLQSNAVFAGKAGQHRGIIIVCVVNESEITQGDNHTIAAGDQRNGCKFFFQISLLRGFQLQIDLFIFQNRRHGAGGALIDRILDIRQGQIVGL